MWDTPVSGWWTLPTTSTTEREPAETPMLPELGWDFIFFYWSLAKPGDTQSRGGTNILAFKWFFKCAIAWRSHHWINNKITDRSINHLLEWQISKNFWSVFALFRCNKKFFLKAGAEIQFCKTQHRTSPISGLILNNFLKIWLRPQLECSNYYFKNSTNLRFTLLLSHPNKRH